MRTLEEIMKTPVSILTEDEISRLDPKTRAWARSLQEKARKIEAASMKLALELIASLKAEDIPESDHAVVLCLAIQAARAALSEQDKDESQ